METRTIIIKGFEKTSGIKKDGTAWHRISIKATDGKFYSTFKTMPEAALVIGAELQLQVIQSKIKENTYEIQKVLNFATRAASGGEPQHSTDSITPTSAQMEQVDHYAQELMDRATKMAHEKMPDWEHMSEYPYLIATLIQTMHGRITNIEIAAQDEKKYKMWGKKV